MQPVTVELSDEDRQFAVDHDLNLESLLATAIARERRDYEYEHPTAELTDSAIALIRDVHRAAIEDDLYSGQQSLTPRRLAVNARPTDGSYTLRVHADEVERLDGADINDTMAESGEFLADVSRKLSTLLAGLNDASPDEFEFELVDHETSPFGIERATFQLDVDPTEYPN